MFGDTNELVSTIQARQLAAFWRCTRRTAVSCTCLAVCLFLEWLKLLRCFMSVPSVVCTIIVYVFRFGGCCVRLAGSGFIQGAGRRREACACQHYRVSGFVLRFFFVWIRSSNPREYISAVFSPKSEH